LPGTPFYGCRVIINQIAFPTAEAYNKKDARVKASATGRISKTKS